ncbi:hypothetical protein AB0M20_43635, partial [Actinoplanes sp. NPDC051633]|uniref:hypothetical protein n=1 Tax=Actinoplanes sp. NPDC051633 TaxID=3155670 RepID=UPI0034400D19
MTKRPGDFAASLLLSGAAAVWLTAAIATLFAGPQYARHYVDLAQDPAADTRTRLVLIAGVVLMMIAAAAAIGVAAALGAVGSPVIRRLTWIFMAIVAVIAVVVMLAG